MIIELSHVILDHTHCGMWVYPTAMTAALILQHSTGCERSEELLVHNFHFDISSMILRGVDEYVGVAEGTGATERVQSSLGRR